MNSNYKEVNVQNGLQDQDSIFHYYKKLIGLRKHSDPLIYGEYKLLLPLNPDLYVYTRTFEDEQVLVILNFFDETPTFTLPEVLKGGKPQLLLSNYEVEGEGIQSFEMRPYEARIYQLKNK